MVSPSGNSGMTLIQFLHSTVVKQSILLNLSLDLTLYLLDIGLKHFNYIAISVVCSIIFETKGSKSCCKV